MASHIDPALLRAFVAVAETGGMTSAGRDLHLTQAAVSQQIKRLEEQLQLELFDRRLRKLSLTPDGERLLGHARRVLALNDEIWGMMTSPGIAGEVKIGVPGDILAPFMPPILKNFSKAWPRVDVTLVVDATPSLLELLRRGEIDLTLTTERVCGDDGEVLLADRLVWAGAKEGDAHKRNPLPVSLGCETCIFRESATKALADSGRDWRYVSSVSDTSALYTTLEADLAVAPLLSHSVPDDLNILVPDEGLPKLPPFLVNLYLPAAEKSEAAVELARHIRKGFAERFPQAA